MHSPKRVRRRKSEEWSAEVIVSNNDLLSDLLLRLPIKSLLKFKCVCKNWLCLISDPNFTRRKDLLSKAVSAISGIFSKANNYELAPLHIFSKANNYELVPLHPLKRRTPLTSFIFVDPPHHDIVIIGSCNGLLLCASKLMPCNECKYYIYNPTTKECRTLPPPFDQPLPPPFHELAYVQIMEFCLACDPLKSHSYRVVCILRHASLYDTFCQIVVYSSETRRWRVSGAPFLLYPIIYFCIGVYCNGAIYWVDDMGEALLCFDLEKELAQILPLPPSESPDGGDSIVYFGESRGHLHLIYSSFVTKFPVYEMERDSHSWFVKFQVDLEGIVLSRSGKYGSEPLYDFLRGVLYVARGEKEEDSFLLMHVTGKVIRYNFDNKSHQVIYNTNTRSKVCKVIRCNFNEQTFEVIDKTYAETMSAGWPFAHQYIESFSPV